MARFGYALCFAAGVISCAVVTTTLVEPATTTEPGPERVATQQAEPPRDAARIDAMSMEMIDRCLQIAEEIDPAMAERLRMYCSDDPDECRTNFMRVGSRLLDLARLEKRDPELYHLKIESLRLDVAVAQKASELREAIASDDIMVSSKLEQELGGLLDRQLIVTLRERGAILNRLESEVTRLKADLTDLIERSEEIKAERLEQLKCGHDPVKVSWPALPPSEKPADSAKDNDATD